MIPIRSTRRILALAAAALLSPALYPQIPDGMRVTVPFAFNIGSQQFPSGAYTIRMVNRNLLSVTNHAKTGLAGVERGAESSGPADNYLVFRKYGARYFLAEYHPFESSTLATIPESKTERIVARNSAANHIHEELAMLKNGKLVPVQP